ncbi:hypothetical protein [Spirosoma rigui]|uniref:hypothetical protein n=1 Tax=Spirosoma rigui TaxID=564064 RepID=UPI0009B08070|nr:hypothetical protein [Spirosoma rigui]
MKLTEEQYELLEAYLKNELSTSDRTLFEADMRADSDLLAEVDRQREIRLGLRAIGIERVLERAKTQYKSTLPASGTRQPAIVRPLATWRYWAMAASIVVILSVAYVAYQETAGGRRDMAYADTMTDELTKGFPATNVPPEVQTRFPDALTSYKAGKYDQVIERLKNTPADKQTVYYKNYFLGLSYLANKQPKEAIPALISASATPSLQLRQKVEWTLALAYVKDNQKQKALPLLKRISADRANPFQSLAQRVLRKLS